MSSGNLLRVFLAQFFCDSAIVNKNRSTSGSGLSPPLPQSRDRPCGGKRLKTPRKKKGSMLILHDNLTLLILSFILDTSMPWGLGILLT